MAVSILVPLHDSISSRGVVDFLLKMPFCPDLKLTFIHVYRKPRSGEELMGKKYMAELPARHEKMLQVTKDRMVREKGFDAANIEVALVEMTRDTVSEEIIDYFGKGKFDMLIIGRKQMSKSEEFIMGDISIKLIRALPKTSILVVKTG